MDNQTHDPRQGWPQELLYFLAFVNLVVVGLKVYVVAH